MRAWVKGHACTCLHEKATRKKTCQRSGCVSSRGCPFCGVFSRETKRKAVAPFGGFPKKARPSGCTCRELPRATATVQTWADAEEELAMEMQAPASGHR